MDVLTHLMDEHRKVESLLARLAGSEQGPQREASLDELERSLRTHMAVEERFVYPLVEKTLGREKAQEADVEHRLAREGLKKLRKLVEEPGFGAAVDMLNGGIGHHVREEERDIFPQLRSRAGEQLAQMDPDEMEQKAMARGSRASTGPSRDELYEQAKRADIPGRSQMTKDELVKALSNA